MHDTTHTDGKSTVQATKHAALRFLERIDPRDPYPEARLREIFNRARKVEVEDVDGEAFVDEDEEVTLVVRDNAIATCWSGVPK